VAILFEIGLIEFGAD